MATIKSYTDLQQSKKLAEILPIESADMYYFRQFDNDYFPPDVESIYPIPLYKDGKEDFNYDIPCWSLAALLNAIPKDESIDCSISFGYYNGKGEYIEKWLCTFEKEDETKDGFIIKTIDGDNPIDVCYEMILELNTLNML